MEIAWPLECTRLGLMLCIGRVSKVVVEVLLRFVKRRSQSCDM